MTRKWISILGAINVLSLAASTLLSFGLSPRVPYGERQPREARCFHDLGERLAPLGERVRDFVSGAGAPVSRGTLLAGHSLPLAISTAVFLCLFLLLAARGDRLEPGTPRLLRRWAIAFALVCVPAAPVLVQDFWLSIAWGRMVLLGLNPYMTPLNPAEVPAAVLRSLPLDNQLSGMTYGPLWALVSAATVFLAGGRALAAATLFKLLLAAAWIGSLWLISRLVRGKPLPQQAAAIAVFGWLPLSVRQTVGEGHNDAALVLLLLAWLLFRTRRRDVRAALALAGSIAVKYVTLPCVLLDLADHLRARRRLLAYTGSALLLAGFLAGIFGVFYRSPRFFAAAWSMTSWHFFTPADALFPLDFALGRLTGAHVAVFGDLGRWLFPALALLLLGRFLRKPDDDSRATAVLAVLAAVLFGAIGHLWPWFLLWMLAPAALVPGSPFSRWIVGLALALPFATEVVFFFPDLGNFVRFFVNSFYLHLLALAWLVWAPRTICPRSAKDV